EAAVPAVLAAEVVYEGIELGRVRLAAQLRVRRQPGQPRGRRLHQQLSSTVSLVGLADHVDDARARRHRQRQDEQQEIDEAKPRLLRHGVVSTSPRRRAIPPSYPHTPRPRYEQFGLPPRLPPWLLLAPDTDHWNWASIPTRKGTTEPPGSLARFPSRQFGRRG